MKGIKKYAWIFDALSHVSIATKTRALKHFMGGEKKYMIKGKKGDIDAIIKCSLCPNMCKFDCPTFNASKNESLSPAGKARLAYIFEKGEYDESIVKAIYECCSCDACKEWCFFDYSLADLLRGVRQDVVEEKAVPDDIMEIASGLIERKTMGERRLKEREGKILYFAGCTVQDEAMGIAKAMMKIFDSIGEEYAVLGDEWCCGYPLYNLGFIKEFKKFAKHNADVFKKYSMIVCSCPTCTYVFKQIYPDMGFKINAVIMHSTEYLARMMEEGKINVENLAMDAVYHDPCKLARRLKITEEPRYLLQHAVNLKEPYFSREETRCCGRGGQLARIDEEISKKIAEQRKEELKSVATEIVTACPSCKIALNAYDIAEIVAMGLK